MTRGKSAKIAISIFTVLAAFPASFMISQKMNSRELVWLIPVLPAFTTVFFWIVMVMTGHFIQNDTYKDRRAVKQAEGFLRFFEFLFFIVSTGFIIASAILFDRFRA